MYYFFYSVIYHTTIPYHTCNEWETPSQNYKYMFLLSTAIGQLVSDEWQFNNRYSNDSKINDYPFPTGNTPVCD